MKYFCISIALISCCLLATSCAYQKPVPGCYSSNALPYVLLEVKENDSFYCRFDLMDPCLIEGTIRVDKKRASFNHEKNRAFVLTTQSAKHSDSIRLSFVFEELGIPLYEVVDSLSLEQLTSRVTKCKLSTAMITDSPEVGRNNTVTFLRKEAPKKLIVSPTFTEGLSYTIDLRDYPQEDLTITIYPWGYCFLTNIELLKVNNRKGKIVIRRTVPNYSKKIVLYKLKG